MEIDTLKDFALGFIEVSAIVLSLALGLLIIAIVYMYRSRCYPDLSDHTSQLSGYWPLFRYFFEHLGEFFRQYFFALDREELPFHIALNDPGYTALPRTLIPPWHFGSTNPLITSRETLFF